LIWDKLHCPVDRRRLQRGSVAGGAKSVVAAT
jgi:hypothetical protein